MNDDPIRDLIVESRTAYIDRIDRFADQFPDGHAVLEVLKRLQDGVMAAHWAVLNFIDLRGDGLHPFPLGTGKWARIVRENPFTKKDGEHHIAAQRGADFLMFACASMQLLEHVGAKSPIVQPISALFMAGAYSADMAVFANTNELCDQLVVRRVKARRASQKKPKVQIDAEAAAEAKQIVDELVSTGTGKHEAASRAAVALYAAGLIENEELTSKAILAAIDKLGKLPGPETVAELLGSRPSVAGPPLEITE